LFGATAVTKHCYCTWFLLLDPERREAWERGDPDAWVITCFYIHRSARRAGLTRTLLEAAVAMAAEHGAKAVEAVPRSAGTPTSSGDGYVGFEQSFADCGFEVRSRPNEKRVLMRRDL
jgi:GNAT superfamily N-acetyltransferase